MIAYRFFPEFELFVIRPGGKWVKGITTDYSKYTPSFFDHLWSWQVFYIGVEDVDCWEVVHGREADVIDTTCLRSGRYDIFSWEEKYIKKKSSK